MNDLEKRLQSVRSRIKDAVKRSGREENDIKLIAVTKTVESDIINEAVRFGITDIGENRVQELLRKYEDIPNNVNWHLIGHLQKNKVKYIIDKAALIHSVDSFELAAEINKQALKIGKIQKILVQVNVSGEESKYGVKPEECLELCQKISMLSNVHIEGLMTMAPHLAGENEIRKVFKGLRQISLDIIKENMDNISMNELSMGMSNDFEIAIEEGATLIRVGTSIFGERIYV